MSEPESEQTSEPQKPSGRWGRRLLALLILTIGVAIVGVVVVLPRLNDFQTDGELRLSGPASEITVIRDEKGMPYVHAKSLRDLVFGQGFVTAQDRLFQMHLMRLSAAGRLTELAGDAALELDIRSRTIGMRRAAEKHAKILNDESRDVFQAYTDGVNAFIRQCPDDIHLEFSLAGLEAEPWSIVDSLSLMYLMAWDTSANLNHEVTAQLLIDRLGLDKASELFPVNINADVTVEGAAALPLPKNAATGLGLLTDNRVRGLMASGPLHVGSNNWTTAPSMSSGDHAMLSGDPHLDPRMLPGIMYAAGYISSDIRAVGAGVPGIPGFIVGRNEHVATAVTNNYGDVQDLYVETVDPDNEQNYLQGGESIPFRVEESIFRIKDDAAPDGIREETVQIRFTERGPVVSGVLSGLPTDRVMTLRWAAAESMGPDTGLTDLLTAKSVDDVNETIRPVTFIVLNFIFADADGNIGWRPSGRLPLRTDGSGTLPVVVDAEKPWTDNWEGWIPFEEMPHKRNPERGWLGTANHYTIEPDYPHYYSNYASPSYRYRRLRERMAAAAGRGASVDDHWSIQRDTKNLMAEVTTPVLVAALEQDDETSALATILKDWDRQDTIDQAGPTVFQAVYGELARQVYADELGEDLTGVMLGNWYFWQERFQERFLEGTDQWFDDQSTADTVETRDELIRRSGKAVLARLTPQLGANSASWKWGRVHTMQFDNPIRRSGFGREWLGSGPHQVNGSGETLYRGWYNFNDPYQVTFAAAMRMVVDFGDSEKVRAVLAGGAAGRTFHPHQRDQIDAYVSGKPQHWWFSDKAIQEHGRTRLKIIPQ